MSGFSVEGFASACEAAMADADDPQAAAHALLQRTLDEHDAATLRATLEAAIPPGADIGEMIVYTSPALTMLYARIPPRFQTGVHNHTIFACIGQLIGSEKNVFYERDPAGGLRVVRELTAHAGGVIDLPADVIHSIENPDEAPGSALHIYGGDFHAIQDRRSLWTADHEEIPFTFPALLRESVIAMHGKGNRVGLEALVTAIPAARAIVDGL